MPLPHLEVCAALVVHEGKLLVARRGPHRAAGGLWEFPGGKIEPGESPETCLERELLEEMDLRIRVGGFFMEISHAYDFGVVHLHTYWASCPSPVFTLKEHQDARWATLVDLPRLDFAPADRPIVERLQEVGTCPLPR